MFFFGGRVARIFQSYVSVILKLDEFSSFFILFVCCMFCHPVKEEEVEVTHTNNGVVVKEVVGGGVVVGRVGTTRKKQSKEE